MKKLVTTHKKRKNSRAKGAVGEREFAKFLSDRGFNARRGQQFHGGPGSPDVVCDALPVHFEVKRVEGTKLLSSWMAQALRDCGEKQPVVAHRRNGDQWLAILPMEDFLKMLPGYVVEVDPDADLLG